MLPNPDSVVCGARFGLLRRRCVAFALVWPAVTGAMPAPAQEPPAGEWLLDHARTLGLNTVQPEAEDAERVLIWLEAATRVNPDLADAYLWQFDLLNRLTRSEAAAAALAAYCRLRPEDLSARIELLDRQFEARQSLEARLAFCAEALQAGGLPTIIQSDLHQRRAELLLRGGEKDQARQEAAEAILAYRGNVRAHELLVELADEAERPTLQIRALLAAIAASPARTDQMWQLARALDGLSLHTEAAQWYDRVAAALKSQPTNSPTLVELLADQASSYADDGKFEQARETAERALAIAPDHCAARFLLLDVARQTGGESAAGPHLEALRKQFDRLDPATVSRREFEPLYLAAWFYVRYDPQPARAVQFASRVRELAPQNAEAQAVYGLAKLAAGAPAEAIAALQPWADRDAWAAAGLGEALLAQGQKDAAIKALRTGEALRRSGRAYERIRKALVEQGQEPAPAADRTPVTEALGGFDERVLEFAAHPRDFLRFELTASRGDVPCGGPWRCELRLTSTAPFPITVGEGQMIAGRVLATARRCDAAEQRIADYLPLSLALRPVLANGESIRLTTTPLVGPAWVLAQAAPQQAFAIEISFVLDPVSDPAGPGYVSALPDFAAARLTVQRTAVDASRTGVQGLLNSLRNGTESERMRAVRTLAALVAEREAARLAPPDYVFHRVDEIKLRRAVLATLADPTPIVRAAALDALRGLEFDPRVLEQVAPALSDANWLVRLLVLDVLAEKQGQVFRPVLESSARAEPDDLVRRAAALRLKQVQRALPQ
jgi:tetratricopeptide (TPR) repeat protein